MPLNGNNLGDAMLAAMFAELNGEEGFEGIPEHAQRMWRAAMRGFVAYFIANAQVIVTSVSGVQTGPGASGPGTGTVV